MSSFSAHHNPYIVQIHSITETPPLTVAVSDLQRVRATPVSQICANGSASIMHEVDRISRLALWARRFDIISENLITQGEGQGKTRGGVVVEDW